jgi:hypothetical protein
MLFYFDLQQFGFCSATKLIQMLQITPPEMLILDNYQLNNVKLHLCVFVVALKNAPLGA